MKINVGKNKLLLSGKAWEIKLKLKEYSHKYQFVHQWIDDCYSPHTMNSRIK